MEIQKDPNNQMQTNDENVGQVSLPFNETQFKDFIVSLLGKPCLSPLKGWTKIVNQFSHSKFRNYDENKTTVYP